MQHYFDVDIAVQYGMLEAVILNNLAFWLAKNEAEKINFRDGQYWSYYTLKAMKELFPYASERKINLALAKLEEAGLVVIDNHNKNPFDRTRWFTLSENAKSILQKCKMRSCKNVKSEVTKSQNGSCENVKCILTDNKTDNETDNITDNIYRRYLKGDFENLAESKPLRDALEMWFMYKRERKQTYTKTGLAMLLKKIQSAVAKYGEAYVVERINESISNNWSGLFFDKPQKSKTEIDESKTDLDDIF